MTATRITQSMMMDRSRTALQTALGRLATTQEQLSTGRILNRPSDSPTGTTTAMRMRTSIADQAQYTRNGEDGLGWLGQTDSTLNSVLDQVRRARDLALQGANTGAVGAEARNALAIEVDQIREGVLAAANTTYLGRPVFGGVTTGPAAYDSAGAWTGTAGAVNRAVADGVKVQVNVDGPDVFGTGQSAAEIAAGTDDNKTLFQVLADLSDRLAAGDPVEIGKSLGKLDEAMGTLTSTLADVGTRYGRIEKAVQTTKDVTLNLQTSLSNVENVDLPRAMVDLQMREVAYQAALASTARVLQPSLLDFLR